MVWRRAAAVAWLLGLAAYFGGMLVLAVGAPAVFSTAHVAGMTMAGIDGGKLDMGNQVGGEVFGAVLNNFAYVEAAALILMAAGLVGRLAGKLAWARTLAVLFCVLAGLALFDLGTLRPMVWRQRAAVRATQADHADPSTPWAQRDWFDTLHVWSERVGQGKFWVLLAMVVLTGMGGTMNDERRTMKGVGAVEEGA